MASIGPRAPFSGSVLSASLQTRLPLCLLLVMFVHFPGGLFSRTSVSRFRVLTSADVHSGGHRSCFTPASLLVFWGRGGGKGLPIESSSRLKCGLNKWPCDVPSPQLAVLACPSLVHAARSPGRRLQVLPHLRCLSRSRTIIRLPASPN